MRERRLREVEISGGVVQKGKNEKALIDNQEKIDNCKIDRNFRVIGYVPDGYCHETNTIYEIYESYHSRQVFDDLKRENQICQHLNCDFVIIWDKV